jgi:hypothetical protein
VGLGPPIQYGGAAVGHELRPNGAPTYFLSGHQKIVVQVQDKGEAPAHARRHVDALHPAATRRVSPAAEGINALREAILFAHRLKESIIKPTDETPKAGKSRRRAKQKSFFCMRRSRIGL